MYRVAQILLRKNCTLIKNETLYAAKQLKYQVEATTKWISERMKQ